MCSFHLKKMTKRTTYNSSYAHAHQMLHTGMNVKGIMSKYINSLWM